ncbi:MAG: hypothetical protein K1X83_08350 [Oligoflexia bacterium]|nr:hypothetical protein [Oligoflexia bacterium]
MHEFGYDRFPPCSLLSYLAGNFSDCERPILWIGKDIWPTPFVLQQTGKNLLHRSIFISPPDKKLLAWSIETALRSKRAALIIAAPGKSGLILTRRLMLCARQGGSLGLLLVSSARLKTPSAAATRWQISPFPMPGSEACGFKLQLLKQQGFCSSVSEWVLELSSDEYGRRSICVRVSAEQKTARRKVAA